MDSFLVCLNWTVQVMIPAYIKVMVLVIVITGLLLWIIDRYRFGQRHTEPGEDEHESFVDQDKSGNDNETKDKIFRLLFEGFRQTKLYSEMVITLATINEVDDWNLRDMKRVLYEYFSDYRLYLRSVVPGIDDVEIDCCILTLCGYKRKHLHKFVDMSPREVRRTIRGIRKKMPEGMYHNIFIVDHCIY